RSGAAVEQSEPWSPGRKYRMGSAVAVIKRALGSFYDDQMTQHAAALTYYSLMSLFPATLLGLSLLGLLGEYPSTYGAIINYLRDVAAPSTGSSVSRGAAAASCGASRPTSSSPSCSWAWCWRVLSCSSSAGALPRHFSRSLVAL